MNDKLFLRALHYLIKRSNPCLPSEEKEREELLIKFEQALNPPTNDLKEKRAEEIKVKGCGKELHHEGADCLIKCGTIHFGNIELCKKCKEKGSDFEVKE